MICPCPKDMSGTCPEHFQLRLPERNITKTPWYNIGSWSVKTEHYYDEFYVLTCIDTTTDLVEFACIKIKLKDVIVMKFENTLLAHYPRLAQGFYNKFGKCAGYAISILHYVLDVPITSKIYSLMPNVNICIMQW